MNLSQRLKKNMEIGDFRPVRDICKSLRVKKDELLECIDDTDGFDVIIGMYCNGGLDVLPKGEWEVERYE